jgi:hypothetical protein
MGKYIDKSTVDAINTLVNGFRKLKDFVGRKRKKMNYPAKRLGGWFWKEANK